MGRGIRVKMITKEKLIALKNKWALTKLDKFADGYSRGYHDAINDVIKQSGE